MLLFGQLCSCELMYCLCFVLLSLSGNLAGVGDWVSLMTMLH